LGVFSAWDCRPRLFNLVHTVGVVRGMLPPRFTPEQIHDLPYLLGQTFLIAFGGTALALLLAFPLGALAARNLTPRFLNIPARRCLEFLRAVPEVVWGLLLVSMAVIGPVTGILALGLHSTGVFAKLYAESIENVTPEPVMALAATGASGIAVA